MVKKRNLITANLITSMDEVKSSLEKTTQAFNAFGVTASQIADSCITISKINTNIFKKIHKNSEQYIENKAENSELMKWIRKGTSKNHV
jgi:hypothetical protein